MIDYLLDKFFFIFHSSLIVFNLIGWAWKKTRPAHLIVTTLTALSWFGLGLWYGFGYCPSTDWHWQVRYRLGYQDLPDSYLQFLFELLTGQTIAPQLVDTVAVVALLGALGISIILNYYHWKHRHAFLSSKTRSR